MLCSNNIIRYHSRSSKGFAGTQLEFRSFEVRGLLLYRPATKHCSNNILQREHRSSKGFAGTHVVALKVSPEHNSSSAVLKLEACCCTGLQLSIVAITYYYDTIVAPGVTPEHMS